MSELEERIRNSISSYLAGDIDATRLTSLLPDGWDLDEVDDVAATDLALFTIGYLAGYQSGDRDEADLRQRLRDLVATTVEVEYLADDLLTVLASRAAETTEASVEGDSSLEAGFEREASQHLRTRRQTTTALLDRPRSH